MSVDWYWKDKIGEIKEIINLLIDANCCVEINPKGGATNESK